MNLAKKTKYLLRWCKIVPKKHLGQNFTIDPSIFQRLADFASLNKRDTVLEIGAGLGFLTRILANKCKHVLAVEFDQKLVNFLHTQLIDVQNIKIIHSDILKVQLPQFNKVVSVPPYHISSPLLLWLFKKEFEIAVMTLQKEFVSRLIAPIGDEDYGWLTVVTYYHSIVELLDEIQEYAFYPTPEVKSIIIRVKPKEPPPFKLIKQPLFIEFVQSLFRQRNRKVRNGVLPYVKSKYGLTSKDATELADSLPFHDKRIRELAPEDFGVLANVLVK
ncbi:MAG: 16S rRNA (adenine(1518)-N(6)/adenine(1519)-N(6))-dimethyltransferase RsmA [Candidatus Bathyarchaeota archaeon]|jgi:16S rRNA (adenine1518-N6/adenine1519-N6)-dimethyltransferase